MDSLDVERDSVGRRHVRKLDIDLDSIPPKRSIFDFKVNIPTIITCAVAVWSMVNWYADQRVWQAKVEVNRQADLDKQDIRDAGLKLELEQIRQQMVIMNGRLDSRMDARH